MQRQRQPHSGLKPDAGSKGGSYLKEDGSLDVNNDTMAECLQYLKDMQTAGALDTIAGGQPDNEEAYPLYNSGDVAAALCHSGRQAVTQAT